MRPKFILLLILLLPAYTFAATFVVTSNAERGTGTLAEALQNAADNGTAERDYITFNLPGNTDDAHTILLTFVLPDITSNVEIDGTTQPGNTFGVSDAKVCLRWKAYEKITLTFLEFTYADNVSIFGLMFYQPYWNGDGNSDIHAIDFSGSNHIVIGAPGKGNYISGFSFSIDTYYPYAGGNEDHGSSTDIVVQSNIIGLNPVGNHDPDYNGSLYYNAVNAINLFDTKDVLIGGDDEKEGNCIFAFKALTYNGNQSPDNGFLKIINNKINTDITGTIERGGASSTQFTNLDIEGNSIYSESPNLDVEIRKNIMVGGIYLSNIKSYFTIQSNQIFNTNWAGEYEALITTNGCNGIIGGETDEEGNDLYSQYYTSDQYFNQKTIASNPHTEIKHNTIHCNQYEGSSVNLITFDSSSFGDQNDYPWVTTDLLKPGYVEGRACKGCRIDIYQDDECHACEGKLFLGSVVADNNKKWSFAGNFTGSVVAMATDANHTTSGFSSPYIDQDSLVVVQPDCSLFNGSIKGLTLQGADRYEWKQITYVPATGEVATFITSDHLDLDNLAPGTYELSPGFGSTCNGISRRYILKDDTYKLSDKNVAITQPSCGGNNGSVLYMNVGNPDYTNNDGYKSLVWKNVTTNTVVDSVLNFEHAFAGNYKLYVTSNGGCIDSSKLYTLVNQSGPTLNVSSVSISNETCSAANGSVTGMTIANASGNPFIQWEDDKGNIRGNNFELNHVPAGNYRFKYKDESACDTIITSYYTVTNEGVVTIDESKKQVKPSSCTVNDGSITGITATNADAYKWTNISDNTTVTNSNKADVADIPADTYQLIVSSSLGCTAKSSQITVASSQFKTLSISSVNYSDADCNKRGGFVHPLFTTDVSSYQFQWIDSIANNPVSSAINADNLPASDYYLMATDDNNCRQKILSQAIRQLGVPAIDDSHITTVNDVCHTSGGAISNLQISGGSGGYQWQWFAVSGELLSNQTSNITSLPEGSYYATVTDKDGCTATSDHYTILNIAATLVPPLLSAPDVSVGNAAIITINNPAAGIYELYRDTADALPVATSAGTILTTPAILSDETWYVRNRNGDCISPFARITIGAILKTRLSIPSAFSPNGDGRNDTWHIGLQGIADNYKLVVYSRFGQPVYTSSDINKDWDGRMNGGYVVQGSYVYVIQVTDNNNQPVRLTGMLTLVY